MNGQLKGPIFVDGKKKLTSGCKTPVPRGKKATNLIHIRIDHVLLDVIIHSNANFQCSNWWMRNGKWYIWIHSVWGVDSLWPSFTNSLSSLPSLHRRLIGATYSSRTKHLLQWAQLNPDPWVKTSRADPMFKWLDIRWWFSQGRCRCDTV